MREKEGEVGRSRQITHTAEHTRRQQLGFYEVMLPGEGKGLVKRFSFTDWAAKKQVPLAFYLYLSIYLSI